MADKPSVARPRLIVPRSATSAAAVLACHNSRLTHGGSVCVRTVGGGAALVGTAHGQKAKLACGTSRQSAMDAVTICAPAPTMTSAPSLARATGSNMRAV